MKAYDPFIYGRSETRKLAERAKFDPLVQAIYRYIEEQNNLIDKFRDEDNPNKITIPGFLRVGFHIHFPEKQGYYSRKLKRFNPEKLEVVARNARREGFDIIAVSNKYDDQVFDRRPGLEFDFEEGRIVVLKAQETGHVMPFGYQGRIKQESLDDVINSTLDQGGLYLLCHPSNRAYHGAGEQIAEQYRHTAILETLSPLVNHPLLNLSFADVIAKEWSLKYSMPGVTVLDARKYLFGGFFVPENVTGTDFSSAQNTMGSLRLLFSLRREELARTGSLKSEYIINTESYPSGSGYLKHMWEEASTSGLTSFQSKLRREFSKAFGIRDRNLGLKNFDYRGMANIVEGKRTHVYLLNGNNAASQFSSEEKKESPNLVFFRKDGKLYIGTTFSNFTDFDSEAKAAHELSRFNNAQTLFLEDILKDSRFHELRFGMHPAYPVACITADGKKHMFFIKEYVPKYVKGGLKRMPERLFFQFYNRFILKGEEALIMASMQSTLLAEGINTPSPLYVEHSQGKGRIAYPYIRFASISTTYSGKPENERRKVLEKAADYLAMLKSKGVYLTDMHLGNIATENGDWFEEKPPAFIVPDVNVQGVSLTTFGNSYHNLINPLSLLFSPRTSFVLKATRPKHRLIQSFDDFTHFQQTYNSRLREYTKSA